jgi:anti-sigma B factor antagonist
MKRNHEDIQIAYFQDVRIIDETRIGALGKELTELATSSEFKKVILNFQNVGFMSSAMIGKLVLFGKNCKTANIDLRLCNINPNVLEVFNLMKLGKVFKIDNDEEAAIKGFSKKGWFG